MTYNPLVKIKERAVGIHQYPPVFCVPGTGGVSCCFYDLANHLSEKGYPVYGFEAPGIFPNTQPLNEINKFAFLYVAALMRDYPSNTYTLGGYCFGALVVFEIARILKKMNYKVQLILIDPTTPRRKINDGLTSEQRQTMQEIFLEELPFEYQQVELAAREAIKNYCPQPMPVEALFITRFDNLLSYDKWHYLTGGNLIEQAMPCHHLDILKEPYVATLAEWIDEYLTGNHS